VNLVERIVLLDQPLPATLPVGHVEVRRITMGPSVAAGPHRHNGPVFGTIERGSVVFQVGDGPETVLRPGDVFHEPAHEVVTRFDATDEGVVFLAFFPLEPGQASAMEAVDPASEGRA
jgi:quercetin dioxygenase-like cupin family protein